MDAVNEKSSHHEFLVPGSFCAVAADRKSIDLVWFVKMENEFEPSEEVDDYGHKVPAGQSCIRGSYLEKTSTNKNGDNYKLMTKIVYFYKESVVYPFVNFEKQKLHYTISKNDLCEIISYVQHFGMSAL